MWKLIAASVVLFATVAFAADSCDGKDKDYCAVDANCEWDATLEKCAKKGCFIYPIHNECVADRKDVGPCTWDWALSTCYHQNQPIPCQQQYVDCNTDQCDFHEEFGFCGPKGEPVPCSLSYNTCPASCTEKDGMCMNPAEANACSNNYDQNSCEANTKCGWRDAVSLCWPKDLNVPCSMFYSASDCPTSRCKTVTLGDSDVECVESNAVVECERFFTAEACPSDRCSFSDSAQRCYDPEIGLDCEEYFDVSECPKDKCRVLEGMCQDAQAPVDCSAIYYGDSSCNKDNGCRPDCDNSVCIVCPASGTCDDTPCPDTPPDPTVNCNKHTTPADCPASSCTWNENTFVCEPKNEGTICEDFLTVAECTAAVNDGVCTWDIDTCISCEGRGDCSPVTTTATPDDDKACSTHTMDNCPYPRCTFKYTAENLEGVCAESTCEDIYDETACADQTACAWTSDYFLCYKKADGIPCYFFYEEAACTTNNCEWNDYTCTGADVPGTACDKFSLANCPARCSIDYETNTCRDQSCSDLFEPDACKSKSGCKWADCAYRCFADDGKACNTYKTYDSCPPSRCGFHYKNGAEEGTCEGKACMDYCDESECSSDSKCQYSQEYGCFSDAGGDCSSFTTVEACPLNRCVWYSDQPDPSTFKCMDKSCIDYYSETECTSNGCDWDSDKYVCYKDTGKNCDTYDSRTCPINRCVYDYEVTKCRDPSCKDYYDENLCTSHAECAFDSTYYMCYNKQAGLPCRTYDYDQSSCASNSDKCSWKSDYNACVAKGTDPDCYMATSKSLCDGLSSCTWSTDFQSCEPSSPAV